MKTHSLHTTLGVGLLALAARAPALAAGKVVSVNCDSGATIRDALDRGNEQRQLTVIVRGTCNESVAVERSDVTLRGDPGAVISGPDPAVDTVFVTGSQVTIESLTITGGRNGVTALGATGLTVRNATIQGTGRGGVSFIAGANGTVDGCTIRGNVRDGVSVLGAAASVMNSVITENRTGINVVDGGSARIGFDRFNAPAGNTITQNRSSGIGIANGATASIALNEITGNGTDPAEAGRTGIGVIESSARIAGGNTISGNAGAGIATRAANVVIGDPALGFSTVNTIADNQGGGVSGFLGTTMVIRDAVIRGNAGIGLIFSVRSSGQIFGSTIENSTGDGIRVTLGSALFISSPGTSATGNAGWGLQCTDAESSVLNTQLLSLSGNAAGGVTPACTGF
jgi:hypothetical protein